MERASRVALFSAIALGVLVVLFASAARASGHWATDWSNRPEPYTMTYLGRPLHCLVTDETNRAGNIGGVTCDFVRYWRGR